MNVVYRLLLQEGMFSEAVILSELDWYYNGLGLNEYYFQHHSPHLIAKHILSYIAAKKYAQTTGTSEKIRFIDEEPSFGLYICPVEESIMIERMIEEKYFGEGYLGTSASIETGTTSSFALKHFLSEGTASPTSSQRIALYLVDNYPFVNAKASEDESDLWKVATGVFLRDKSSSAKHRYQKALSIATSQLAPAVIVEEDPLEPSNCVIVVAYKKGSTHSFLSTLTQLIAINKCTCPRKYIEQFSNGYVIHSIHLRTGLEEATHFAEQTKLLYMLPRTTLTPLFAEGKLTLNEMVYAYSCWKFAYHFMARSSVDEFNLLWKALEKDPVSQARLLQLKKRMRNDVLTEQRISDSIFENWQLVKELYKDFETHHKPATPAPTRPNGINAGLEAKIKKAVADIDYDVLRAFLVFNSSVVKTNFYIKNKTALSFRFDTGFLRGTDYPQLPYAILMFVGAEFRGFHVRFDDIARGGLRMIRSANKQAYLRNAETLFDENYNLAWTQEKKNKDIPESGSKGTILLSIDHQNKAFIAFKKYIDAMLDLLLPNSDIVDHYGLPEYIFCGPDEGTADVMDWACLHAKSRGYRYWTGFTTGKSVTLGGIPHDLYGMTTRGVHEYVLGIMKKLNIKEESVFKLQTGGPDGDLGSNEIKISKDKTKAIIDGSGVLYDPNGIDRTEMLRLANKRAMVQEFDTSKLSKDGFLVLIKDKDVKLPNGTIVENGMMFRNLFHLNPLASCELFVPCGGRPEAVNLNNVDKLFFPDGTPMFKYVIEGANLFFTQEARLKLEEAGVVVYKDASANKGGVTSSSMEVLAALALSEEEYIQHMCVKDGKTPEFYEKYVVEVQNKIADNARQEFECIWNEHERTGVYRCLLTDQLSIKINTLTQEVKNSGLWKDEKMRKKILLEALPQTLLGKISIDKIIERVPTNYLDALLSAHLASRYIYQSGLNPNEFSFYMFMAKYLESQK
jgi:glutamate dehydrogenase